MRRKRPTQQGTGMNMNICAHTSPTLICNEPGTGALREEVLFWVPWQLVFSTRTFNLVALISFLHAKEKFFFRPFIYGGGSPPEMSVCGPRHVHVTRPEKEVVLLRTISGFVAIGLGSADEYSTAS